MKTYHLNYHFELIPPVMKRGQQALILVKDQTGKFVLGSKKIYPDNIYRLVGGGIDQSEDPKLGACRELAEELNLKIKSQDLQALAKIITNVSSNSEKYKFITFLFYLETDEIIEKGSDDLDGIIKLDKAEFKKLIQNFYNTPKTKFTWDEGLSKGSFYWSDYGQFFGRVHEIAINLVK